MATNIDTLETRIRRYARNASYDADAAENLLAGNVVTRMLAALVPWRELTRDDQTVDTVDGTESYTWPDVFIEVTAIHIVDPEDSTRLVLIGKYTDDVTWKLAGNQPNGFPEIWRKEHDGTNNIVSLRPIPDFTGTNNVKITGIIEPDVYTDGSSTTPFESEFADDILSHLWAADQLFKEGTNDHANWNVGQAIQKIRLHTGIRVDSADLVKQLR